MTDPLTLRQGGWRYLVPNGLTATNLTFGTMSCFYSVYGNSYLAGWFILLAVCFDRFDGAAARALRATGRFGIEFDSLADLVSFGVAPAFLVFSALVNDPRFGYGVPGLMRNLLFASCGFYVLATAFRLARFNVFAQTSGAEVYLGLPSPAAAATVVAGYLVLLKYSGDPNAYPSWSADIHLLGSIRLPDSLRTYYPIVVTLTGLLMVFGLKFPKFQSGRSPGKIYILVNMILAYIFVFMRIFPEYLLLVAFQTLGVAVTYHYFSKSAKTFSKQPLLEALSAEDVRSSGTSHPDGSDPEG